MSKKFKISLISSSDAGSFEQAQEDGHYSTPGTYQPNGAALLSEPVTPSAPHTLTAKHGWAFAGKALNLINTLTRGQAGWFHRLFSFLLIGGLGALVNLVCFSGIYYLLSQSGNTSLAFFLAFIIATEVSIVCNFVLNDRFTFRHLHQSHLSWSTRCVRFHITSIGGTALTLGISFSLLHLVHVSAFLAQAIALIAATAFNFTFHHIFTYRHGGRRNNHNNTRSAQIADHTVLEQIPDSYINAIPSIETRRQISMKTLIIIPTYNELENLPLLLRQIFSYAPATDVLIVDDNSPDGTGKLAEEIRKQDSRVHVLHRPGKLGLGTAYIAGFKYAIQHGYDAAFEMDADFSHDPCFLPGFLQTIKQADLVIGSRYIPGGSTPNWSFVRRLISGSGNIFARFMLGIPVHDCTGGFRCYRRHVLENIDLDAVQSRGYAFQVEMTYRVLKRGFKIVETPITFMDRRLGKSKMSRKIVIEAFTYVLRTRFSKQSYQSPSVKLQSNDRVLSTTNQYVQKGDSLPVAIESIQADHHVGEGQSKQGRIARDHLSCTQQFPAVIAVSCATEGAQLCGIDPRCPEKWQRNRGSKPHNR